MLVLGRKLHQSIWIGDALRITLDITPHRPGNACPDRVRVTIDTSKKSFPRWLFFDQPLHLDADGYPGVCVSFRGLGDNPRTIKLGIEAPQTMRIWREEIYLAQQRTQQAAQRVAV